MKKYFKSLIFTSLLLTTTSALADLPADHWTKNGGCRGSKVVITYIYEPREITMYSSQYIWKTIDYEVPVPAQTICTSPKKGFADFSNNCEIKPAHTVIEKRAERVLEQVPYLFTQQVKIGEIPPHCTAYWDGTVTDPYTLAVYYDK